MSGNASNSGGYDPYRRQSGWTQGQFQHMQSSQAPQVPQSSGSSSAPAAIGSYNFSPVQVPQPRGTHGSYSMMMSPSIVDDRSFFQHTPVPPNAPYSPAFTSSESSSDTRPSTSMDTDYRERSLVPPPSTSAPCHSGSSTPRSDIGNSNHPGAVFERQSVRDVRKRAYDYVTRLDAAARRAGEDVEANLSVLAFAARPDTKDHSNNTPRIYVSPSLEEAFCRRGITDVKAFMTSVAYDTRPADDLPTPELVANLKSQVSNLTSRVSSQQMDIKRLEGEMALLKEENERLRRFAEGHAVVSNKLQEVTQLSHEFSWSYAGYTQAGQNSTSGTS